MAKNILKGQWVRVYKVVLSASQRSANLPEDTKKVPMEMWDKGFLINDEAKIGDQVQVETIVGRIIEGELVELNPSYEINYGECITETLYIGKQLREMIGD